MSREQRHAVTAVTLALLAVATSGWQAVLFSLLAVTALAAMTLRPAT